jgi:hypothetical protein
VENEHTTTPAADRKRAPVRKKRGSDDVVDSRKAKAAKSSHSAPAAAGKLSPGRRGKTAPQATAAAAAAPEEGNKKKSHYPSIEFDTSKIAAFIKTKGKKSHAELLDKIVVDVCQAETVGLEKFMKENGALNNKGRADLLRVMKAVLDELPGELTGECPVDVEFEPEFKEGEKDEVGVLSNVLATLREQADALTKYEADIKTFATEHDLWLDGPSDVVSERISEMASSSSSGKDEDGVDVVGMAAGYGSTLDEISEYCESILEKTKNAASSEAKARSVQDSLYKGYQRVRFEAKGGVNLPEADPKTLVKGLQK